MYDRATDGTRGGSALVGTLIAFTAIVGLTYTTTLISAVDLKESRRSIDEVRVAHLADAGLERGLHFLGRAAEKSGSLDAVVAMFDDSPKISPFVGAQLMDGLDSVGAYSVSIALDEVTASAITLTIDATGYLPDAPQNLAPGESVQSWKASSVTVSYGLGPSEVFDYGYFINNWGWFYGNTIVCDGNSRSNGQFDVAGYKPTITGQPLYDSLAYDGATGDVTLSGYLDDNGDGKLDGNDGGIWSGWAIAGAQNVQGVGGNVENQHAFVEALDMPNLTDLTSYEELAKEFGTSITAGGTQIDAVYGDEPGESGNLYLHGTEANPIVLNGLIVAHGDVIISGYVTGQGTIFSGGNVYCPDSILYLNGPKSKRPTGNGQAATEDWLEENWDADFLGLFAREHLVVGDHTNTLWQQKVNAWLNSKMNKSEEDAGEDGIPNTIAGFDGILGTADDDLLEDDGVFTVEYYSEEDDLAGLIPSGKKVGDVVPGSGEDIDGDGVYDASTTYADLDFDVQLNKGHWGGNMPNGGIKDYSDIATLYANNLDAVFYTNHAFCWLVLGDKSAEVNGAIVSRNESIIYGTPEIRINFDCRLLGGGSGAAAGLLPSVLKPAQIMRWRELDEDPNFHLVVE